MNCLFYCGVLLVVLTPALLRLVALSRIRNSRLIQLYRLTVFFLSLNISRKSLIYKGFFAFLVHFGICGAYILCPKYHKMQESTTPHQGVVLQTEDKARRHLVGLVFFS